MKKFWIATAAALLMSGGAAWAGGDVDAGKAAFESKGCADCHYEDDFAGVAKADIKGMLKGVMAGEVEHDADLSGLSGEDVANLAAYFASFE